MSKELLFLQLEVLKFLFIKEQGNRLMIIRTKDNQIKDSQDYLKDNPFNEYALKDAGLPASILVGKV